jgi:hypothetical protein
LNRLKNLSILKLEDELLLAESKVIWRWDKNQIPIALKPLLIENNVNLRERKFVITRNSANNSIKYRLAKRATSSIRNISKFKCKKSLSVNLRKELFTNKYTFNCNRRGCYICAN